MLESQKRREKGKDMMTHRFGQKSLKHWKHPTSRLTRDVVLQNCLIQSMLLLPNVCNMAFTCTASSFFGCKSAKMFALSLILMFPSKPTFKLLLGYYFFFFGEYQKLRYSFHKKLRQINLAISTAGNLCSCSSNPQSSSSSF